jgi:hypothetical protein
VSRPLLVATALNLLYIPALVAFAVVSPLQRLVPRDLLARVISFDWFSDAATKPIGMAAVGPLAARAGIHRLPGRRDRSCCGHGADAGHPRGAHHPLRPAGIGVAGRRVAVTAWCRGVTEASRNCK